MTNTNSAAEGIAAQIRYHQGMLSRCFQAQAIIDGKTLPAEVATAGSRRSKRTNTSANVGTSQGWQAAISSLLADGQPHSAKDLFQAALVVAPRIKYQTVSSWLVRQAGRGQWTKAARGMYRAQAVNGTTAHAN